MPTLYRKISRAKWQPPDVQVPDDFQADAITSCLRTNLNELSVWAVPADTAKPRDEVALALASDMEKLDTIDVVELSQEYLEQLLGPSRQSPGKTRVKDLVEFHRDLTGLTYRLLGSVARHVAECIEHERWERYSRRRVRDLILSAIQAGRLTPESLRDKLRDEMGLGTEPAVGPTNDG